MVNELCMYTHINMTGYSIATHNYECIVVSYTIVHSSIQMCTVAVYNSA